MAMGNRQKTVGNEICNGHWLGQRSSVRSKCRPLRREGPKKGALRGDKQMDSGQSPTLGAKGTPGICLDVRSKHQITTYENQDGPALKGRSQYKAMQLGGIGGAGVLKWSSGQRGAWVVMKGAGRILNGNFGQGSKNGIQKQSGYLVAQNETLFKYDAG